MNKNIKTLKTELVKHQGEYIKAKAENEATIKIEKECKIKILTENVFITEGIEEEEQEDIERIYSPSSDYRMSEFDFTNYCKLVYAEEIKNGLDIPDYNTTADYKTSKNLKKAENELLKIGIDIIVEKENANREDFEKVADHWKLRDEMIELVLQLAI